MTEYLIQAPAIPENMNMNFTSVLDLVNVKKNAEKLEVSIIVSVLSAVKHL